MRAKRDYHDNEIMNLRAFYLRLLKILWIPVLAGVLGAVLGGLIYFLATVVFAPQHDYVTKSTLYINFAYDEKSGTKVDYYNAYTWNIKIKDDEVLDAIMKNLADAGYTEESGRVSRAEVMESMNADIPSDVRVMVFEVRNKDKELSGAIADAANAAMVSYGQSNDAFEQIKVTARFDTELETVTDKTVTAVIFGAVLGVIISIIIILLITSMDDMIYVPADAERRYRLPVLGVVAKNPEREHSYFKRELQTSIRACLVDGENIAVISADDAKNSSKSAEAEKAVSAVAGHTLIEEKKLTFKAVPLPGNDTKSYDSLKEVDGVIIAADMWKHNGAVTEQLISQLQKIGCPVKGMVITSADMGFLKMYYGIK